MLRTPRTPIFPRDEPSTDPSSYQPLTTSSSSRQGRQALKENIKKYSKEEDRLRPWYARRTASIAFWILGTVVLIAFASVLIRPTASPDVKNVGNNADSKPPLSTSGGTDKEASTTDNNKPGKVDLGQLPPSLAVFLDEDNFIWTVNTTGNTTSTSLWYTCKTVDQAIMKVVEWKTKGPLAHVHRPYYYNETEFVDPADLNEGPDGVCERSLTYVLGTEGVVAGMGPQLMGIWLAYGLAKEEGREFFVDDSSWEYGPLSHYFDLPPPPSCKPPPKKWMTPCPHQARHLVFGHSMLQWSFGHSFIDQFEDASKMGVLRQRKIFNMMNTGYTALSNTSTSISNFLKEDALEYRKGERRVAVHIRHGDVHAKEFKYSKSYIPLTRYIKFATNETVPDEAGGPQMPKGELLHYPTDYKPVIYMASDDSTIFDDELVSLWMERGEIEMLGGYRTKKGFTKEEFNKLSLEERVKLGEGYVIDMKEMIDAIGDDGWAVCGLQASMCRILAVGMGWHLAIEKEHWVNIDGQFPWFAMNW